MITICTGNLLESKAEALVNPVNIIGVAGAGLALAFKKRFPGNHQAYVQACIVGKLKPGVVFCHFEQEKWIMNFPTKVHWKNPSRIGYITEGLPNLIIQLERRNIKSVAIPAIGCGLGGLKWSAVKPAIENAFKSSDIEVHLYPPGES